MKQRFNLTIEVETDKINAKDDVLLVFKDIGWEVIEIKKVKNARTSQQNRALHEYFKLLSESLNDAGYDMKKLVRKEIDIPWNPMTIKEYLWRPIQKIVLGEKSTTKLTSESINQIYDIINKTVSERTGISIPFPSLDILIEKQWT
mgnify:CR=1 FL=1